MKWLVLILLAGCVDGVPYSPTEPCPVAVVYITLDKHHEVLVTDSIDYTPECK